MKKVVRLTESDLVRLVKKVIKEQATQKIQFKLNNETFQIENTTQIDSSWTEIKYVKILNGGMAEKKLNIGYVLKNKPTFIYPQKNPNIQPMGPTNVNLISVSEQPTASPFESAKLKLYNDLSTKGYFVANERKDDIKNNLIYISINPRELDGVPISGILFKLENLNNKQMKILVSTYINYSDNRKNFSRALGEFYLDISNFNNELK